MNISEDRTSHIAHKVLDRIWKNDLVDFPTEPRDRSGGQAQACFIQSGKGSRQS